MAQDVKITLSAQDKTAAAFKTATANLSAMKTSAVGVGALLGGIGAGISLAGIVSLTKSVIDSIDSLNDLRDATGASIENISALEDVAARTGTSMDTVASSLVKFNKVLSDAKPGSDAAKALQAIGLSAEDLKRIDPAEALRQTAVALAGFADDGNKARLVQELFGKSAKETAPFLKDLAEQTSLVGRVTSQQAAEAEKFNKQLFDMQKNAQDVARELAGPMMQAFNYLLVAGANVAYVLKATGNEIGGIAAQAVALSNLDFKGFSSIGDAMRADAAVARKELDDLQKRMTSGVTAPVINARLLRQGAYDMPTVGAIPDKPKKTGGGGSSSAKKDPYADAARYIDSLQKQIDKTQELTAVQQLGMDINAGRIGKMTDAQRQQLLDLAQKLDSTKAQTEAEKELTKALEDRNKAEQDSLAQLDTEYAALIERLTASTPTKQFASQQADLAALQTALADGAISEQLYAEAVAARFELTNDKLKEGKTAAEEIDYVFTNAFKGMEDALVSFVTTGKLDFGSLVDSMIADLARMAIQQEITKPLMGMLGGMFSGAGTGTFDPFNLISFDGGGYTGASARSGGLDGKGGFMAMLHPQETVTDHTKSSGSSRATPITIINQTTGRIDKVVEQTLSNGDRAILIQEAVNATAAQLSDPNSRTSRAMSRNYNTARSR